MGKTKLKKKVFSIVLAVCMAFSGMQGLMAGGFDEVLAAGNTAPGKPTDLKIEMLSEAYGIDTNNPSFSWVVNDEDPDEIQTAYRLVVSKTSALAGDVLDTGWVYDRYCFGVGEPGWHLGSAAGHR